MKIKDFLKPSRVSLDVQASDKASLLKELSSRAASALNLPFDLVLAAIEKRDALGSTGIGHGVSIPHARFIEVKHPYGLFIRLRNPINFDAIDNEPVDLVFLLLLPAANSTDQLDVLAVVARKLRDAEVLLKLRQATDLSVFYRLITG